MAKSVLLPCFNPYMYTLILYVATVGYVMSSPTIKYTCTNSIVDHIEVSNGNISNVRVLKKDGTLCDKGAGDNATVILCITEIKNETGKNDTVESITLLYEREKRTEIIGGQNSSYFTLTCNANPANKTATAHFSIDGTKQPLVVPAEILQQPTLSISKQSPIHIGDKLTLKMTVDANYILKPIDCMASENTDGKNKLKIWGNCDSIDTAIIPTQSWTKKLTQSTLSLDMYAFKFTDSNEVHITCTTTVCQKGETSSCNMVCPTHLPLGRRRRNAMNHDESDSQSSTKSATVSFEITSTYQSNSSKGICSYWYQYIFAIILSYWFVKRS